ncbi:MAG: T9SS type A sorting domain-containing protein, partial [Bacteroidota bacterium]
ADLNIVINNVHDVLEITSANITNGSGYQTNDGRISIVIDGGLPPYNIVWTRVSDNQNLGNTLDISNLLAGEYQVDVTDANGCPLTEIFTVTEPDIVEETITSPSCTGDSNGSIEIIVNQGNGSFTYSWNTGATTNFIDGLGAGSYTVTITGFGDGPLVRTYVIEDPLPLEVDLGEDRVLCLDQELVLDATVEDTTAIYEWTSDNGFSSSEPSINIAQTGNYTVTVSTESGCTAMGSIFVAVSTDEINAEFAVSSQVFVGEALIAVDISFPLPDTLEWIIPDEATVLNQDSDELELVFSEPGEYEVGIRTTKGDCIAMQQKKVLVLAEDGTVADGNTENGSKLIEEFIVYPNPTTGRFTADVNLTERGNISIKVFNLTSNALRASEKARGETTYSIPFDLSGLPSGVYAVLLETPYGDTVRKIIIQ